MSHCETNLFDCLKTREERAADRRRRIIEAVRDYQTRQHGCPGQRPAGAVRVRRARKGRS